ncbi:MAG: HdeD family acid-resistance protein [Lachnospiraceae bacterium]
MKEFMNSLKSQVMLSAVLCIVLGLAFIIWPLKITSIICRVLALIFIVMGAERVIRFLQKHAPTFVCVLGGLEFLIGLWIFVKPQSIQALIPIIIGFLLLLHGIQDAAMAWRVKESGASSWWFGMLCAVCNIIFALILMCNALGVVKIGMMFIGAILVYDGVSDFFVAAKADRVLKEFEQDANAVDTTWRE